MQSYSEMLNIKEGVWEGGSLHFNAMKSVDVLTEMLIY